MHTMLVGDPRRHVHRAAGRVLLLPERERAARPRRSAAHARRRRSSSPTSCSTQAKVAFVPGEAFGAPGYARFSFALGDDDLVEGITPPRRPRRRLTPPDPRSVCFIRATRACSRQRGMGQGRHQRGWRVARPVTTTSTRHSATCSTAPSTSPVMPPILRIGERADGDGADDGRGGERPDPPAGRQRGDRDAAEDADDRAPGATTRAA